MTTLTDIWTMSPKTLKSILNTVGRNLSDNITFDRVTVAIILTNNNELVEQEIVNHPKFIETMLVLATTLDGLQLAINELNPLYKFKEAIDIFDETNLHNTLYHYYQYPSLIYLRQHSQIEVINRETMKSIVILPTNTPIRAMKLHNTFLYAITGEGLYCWDIIDDYFISIIPLPNINTSTIEAYENKLYFSDNKTLVIYNLNTKKTVYINKAFNINNLLIKGNKLYLIAATELEIIDCDNDTVLQKQTLKLLAKPYTSIQVTSKYLYIETNNSLFIYSLQLKLVKELSKKQFLDGANCIATDDYLCFYNLNRLVVVNASTYKEISSISVPGKLIGIYSGLAYYMGTSYEFREKKHLLKIVDIVTGIVIASIPTSRGFYQVVVTE